MIIVGNKIINSYTHIEIYFQKANNKHKRFELSKSIHELTNNLKQIFKPYSLYNKNEFLSVTLSIENNNYNIFELNINSLMEQITDGNIEIPSVDLEQIDILISELKKQYKQYDFLLKELTNNCYAVFYNNDDMLSKSKIFESKEELINWLHENEIVPTNSFKELQIKAGL